ncbi:NADH-dependent flavin oxidoreductase [Fundicoccus sp. Sow4_H7]|uniref:NADH-dependent flavin oxidoreductase n=1 Tax=Fundicoccus sp. Sow4_H7 TaxID=3438784 RepID=UPI003F900E18
MSNKYHALLHAPAFPNGVQLDSRFVMSPMVVDGSSYEGDVQDDDIRFFERRAQTAAMLITGAATVGPFGNAFGYGLGNYRDDQLDGLKKLAASMKSKGAKALMQLFHPGRQAAYTYKDEKVAYGPSDQEFPFLDYPVTGMSSQQVEALIKDFGQATRRAIDAGFDGVEIHGANHYLLQQFFSAYSNHRDDAWGGDLDRRMALPLAVLREVKVAAQEKAADGFIIGYRISPEEIHGDNIGYRLDEMLVLVEALLNEGLDYIHTSQWGEKGYSNKAQQGQYEDQAINQVIREKINGRALLIGAGDVTSPDKALEALDYVDLVALASAAIVEPDFSAKIKADQADTISLDITGRLDDLALPKEFYRMANTLSRSGSIPQTTLEQLKNK